MKPWSSSVKTVTQPRRMANQTRGPHNPSSSVVVVVIVTYMKGKIVEKYNHRAQRQ